MPRRRALGPLSRRQWLKAALVLGAGTFTGTALYGFAHERHRLQLTQTRVPVAGLAPALEGLRIALLTDLHRSETVSRAHIERAVALALSARPDLVVLGGDYVTWRDRTYIGDSAASLAGLSAPYGVFAVLGNHDDDREVPAALSRQGFSVLRDARTRLSIRGEALDLVGIRFWTRRAVDIAPLTRGAGTNTILLAHDPRMLREAAALRVPLVLSGHTHGGQVVLPGVGALVRRRFRVSQGLAREGDSVVFVSRGVGTVYVPLRLNCPPEVSLLTLARA